MRYFPGVSAVTRRRCRQRSRGERRWDAPWPLLQRLPSDDIDGQHSRSRRTTVASTGSFSAREWTRKCVGGLVLSRSSGRVEQFGDLGDRGWAGVDVAHRSSPSARALATRRVSVVTPGRSTSRFRSHSTPVNEDRPRTITGHPRPRRHPVLELCADLRKLHEPACELDLLRVVKPRRAALQVATHAREILDLQLPRDIAQHRLRDSGRIGQEHPQPPHRRQLQREPPAGCARRDACRSAPCRRHRGRTPDRAPPATGLRHSGRTRPPPHPTRTRPAPPHNKQQRPARAPEAKELKPAQRTPPQPAARCFTVIASSAVSRPPASAVDPDRLPSAVIENTKPTGSR